MLNALSASPWRSALSVCVSTRQPLSLCTYWPEFEFISDFFSLFFLQPSISRRSEQESEEQTDFRGIERREEQCSLLFIFLTCFHCQVQKGFGRHPSSLHSQVELLTLPVAHPGGNQYLASGLSSQPDNSEFCATWPLSESISSVTFVLWPCCPGVRQLRLVLGFVRSQLGKRNKDGRWKNGSC